MSWTHKQWRQEVERMLAREGVRHFAWEMTNSQHQRVSGKLLIDGGRELAVSLTVSLSPSCHRAPHHVRRDAKRMLRAARSMA